MKIYLSPSDQTGNITASGHSEQEHCTKIAQFALLYLNGAGYEVKLGDNSNPKTYAARVNESNEWQADLHIAIHTNAGGGEGTVMFHHPLSRENEYVKSICDAVSEISPGKDRGMVERSDLYELTRTHCPCAYLEVEFHDNEVLEQWIDANVEKIGLAIAKGVAYVDGKPIEGMSHEEQTGNVWKVQVGAFVNSKNAHAYSDYLDEKGIPTFCYKAGLWKVQAGAFEIKENAEKFCESLKARGIDAIVVEG